MALIQKCDKCDFPQMPPMRRFTEADEEICRECNQIKERMSRPLLVVITIFLSVVIAVVLTLGAVA